MEAHHAREGRKEHDKHPPKLLSREYGSSLLKRLGYISLLIARKLASSLGYRY